MMVIERRGAARAPAYRLIMQVYGAGSVGKFNGVLGNLSISGCFIQTYSRVHIGESIRVWMFLPSERWQEFRAEVVHQIERVGFGLRFVDLTDKDQDLLTIMVEYINGHSANYSPHIESKDQPESQALQSRPPEGERRLYARSCPINAHLVEGKEEALGATIENISMGGLYLRTKKVLPEGASTVLGIPVGVRNFIMVRVEVIHSHLEQGFGVRFQWLSENDANRIVLAREMVNYSGRLVR